MILSVLEILVLLHEFGPLSNAKGSRSFRKDRRSINRTLQMLKEQKLVEVNKLDDYVITKLGSNSIRGKYDTYYYEKLKTYIKNLKEHPEKKGWTPKDLDLGGITLSQSELLYIFEDDEELFSNALLARMLRIDSGTIHKDLRILVSKNLLERNNELEYHLTPKGLDLIRTNVFKNKRCELTREFVLFLKKSPARKGLYGITVAGLASLGLIKSNSVHATTLSTVSNTTIPSSTYAATPVQSVTASAMAATTGTTTTTSVLTTKTALASILATLMVTGGIAGPYAFDPDIFGNSIPNDMNTINENSNLSTSQKLSSSHSFSDTSTSSKSAKSSVSSNTQSSTTTQSTQIQSQESNLENTQNDSQITDSSSGSSSDPTTSSIPSVTILSQFPKNAIPASAADIKVDKFGNRWIADPEKNQVLKLNSQGERILTIGGTTQEKNSITPTSGPFDAISHNIQLLVIPYVYADDSDNITLNKPTKLAINNSPAGDDSIYIVDSGNKRILKVDQDGNHMPDFRFDCNGTIDSKQFKLCENYQNSKIFNPNIAASNDGNSLLIHTDSDFHLVNSIYGTVKKTDCFKTNLINSTDDAVKKIDCVKLNFVQIIVRDQHIYAFDDVTGTIYIFDSDKIVDIIPLKDQDARSLIPFSFTVDKSEQFIYVFGVDPSGGSNPDRILYKYNIDGKLLHSEKYDGFITGMDINSEGNILALDVVNEQITIVSFEDAVATFSKQFDEIMCDVDSMINDPVSVPPEIVDALPVSELLTRANDLSFDTQQYEEGLLFYYITSQIQPTNVNAWNGIGYTQTQICNNNSAEIAYTQVLSIDPNNINAKIGLADFTINQVTRDDESILKLEDTELQLQSILELDSRNTNALNALGYIETLRENYDKAIDYYQDSLTIDNKKTTTLNGLAFAHLRSNNLGEAATTYLKVINIDPNNFDALIGLITTYTQQGFPELAVQFIDKLDESNGIVTDKLIEQGNWLQQNGQVKEAQRLFDATEKLKLTY